MISEGVFWISMSFLLSVCFGPTEQQLNRYSWNSFDHVDVKLARAYPEFVGMQT